MSKQVLDKANATVLKERIAKIWDDVLSCGPVADDVTFFEAGGTSLTLVKARLRMQQELGIEVDMTQMFETPRLGDLAQALADQNIASFAPLQPTPTANPRAVADPKAIAIIGYAARVPGAASREDFWQHIRSGANLIDRFDPADLAEVHDPETLTHPDFVPARSVLPDVEMFDAKYFGILPKEAQQMDPQARVFLEICAEAMDDAGVDPSNTNEKVGVYAGATHSTYLLDNVMQDRGTIETFTSGFQLENYATFTGNIADTLATRVAFKLNLKGPAMSISTTCSTSLTAIAQAVTALRAGQCGMALAGGVSITFPQQRGYIAKEGGMASTDGLCRPFDADAGGTVFGHGAGVLVLKPLTQAMEDGDQISGVIRGVGINNDGADKIAFTAPSVRGQADAIRAAHEDAGIDPSTISYVECHGTATPLGDPIEIKGLSLAFDTVDTGDHVAIGTVKGNIGHLDAGAGVVGTIKLLEMFKAQEIPPVAHFKSPNPRIDFESGPFFVPAGVQPWTAEGPRRAGVSGFGVGGTNVHLVLEEGPVIAGQVTDGKDGAVQILPLSAKSAEALTIAAQSLADRLEHPDAPALDDAAYTLQDGRQAHAYRLAVAANTHDAAVAALRRAPKAARPVKGRPPVCFMFPGQGAQFPGMAGDLYAQEPEFRTWLDRGQAVLGDCLGTDLLGLLCSGDETDAAADLLRQTSLAQPALFLTSFATAKLWMSRGVQPDALIGHSVGEYVAAALAGVMTFEDALGIVTRRGAFMQAQPPGVMLSVRGPLEALGPFLDDVDLAGANAPKLQVVSGPEDAIARLEHRLDGAGIATRRLHTSHAFHSAMMDPIVPLLRDEISKVALSDPQIQIISTVSGDPMGAQQATDPDYWASQARAPVHFAKAVTTLAKEAAPLFVEVGPGKTLATFTAQTLKRDHTAGVVTSLPGPDATETVSETLASATGAVWAAGVPVQWDTIRAPGSRKVSLPGPVFMKKRHWIDPVRTRQAPVPQAFPRPSAPNPVAQPEPVAMTQPAPRIDRLMSDVTAIFADLSGEDLTPEEADIPFLELGFDSLFMGQAAQAISKKFGVDLTFRALLSAYPSISALSAHLDEVMPQDAMPAPVAAPAPSPAPQTIAPIASPAASAPVAVPVALPAPPIAATDMASLAQAQMQTMQAVFADQMRALGGAPQAVQVQPIAPVAPAPQPEADPGAPIPFVAKPRAETAKEPAPKPKAFKFGRGPNLSGADLNAEQARFAADLAKEYSKRYAGSKAHTEAYRGVHADPRSVAGFRPEWKELTFPIVAKISKGAWIEDVDGNRFVDLVNGFGQTAFGHAPDFVSEAVTKQLEQGYALGPQADRAGPVAERFAKMVGHERVTFCNTGSEAVMAAMRLARAVTGREQVVVFSNDYHGQFDEVLVKGRSRGTSPTALPIAPGIPKAAVSNMIVLDYGADASLDWIKANGDDLAAVVVEPVQSRNPELRPEGFVRSLREITHENGAALVIDEVVTGFRTHAKGMQGVWDIQPDMATYGKVVGGGMPIGMLAGCARFMDALDGGAWSYGDDSAPQVAPTFFAGTFVRHPLVVAAVDAVLEYLETEGERLWTDSANRAADLAGKMNAALAARGLPALVKHYSSWFVIKTTQHDPRAALLYPLLRLEGVHLLDGFCGFLTTEHGDAECEKVLAAFEIALDKLQSVGILPPEQAPVLASAVAEPSGPTPARLRPVESGVPVPLTESQREIWMVHQLGDVPATSYNESVSLRIDGPLDRDILDAALSEIVQRHDALRARFARDGSTFTVSPQDTLNATYHDLQGATDTDAALTALLGEDAKTPIDLVAGPPIRAHLAQTGSTSNVLILTAHHIICDGWSFNTVIEDLAAVYSARVSGNAPDLAPAPSFAQFAQTEHATAPTDETRAFWKTTMQELPDLPELPTDHARQAQRSFNGATVSAQIPASQIKALRKAGGRLGATLFSTVFAGLQITLGRLSGARDVALCVPMGGHAHLEDQSLVGHLVNFLPIRADFDPSEAIGTHVSRAAEAVMTAQDHSAYTLGTLVKDLDLPRQLNRLPVSEVQFNLERVAEGLAMGPAKAEMRGNPKAGVNYDLFFNCVEDANGLRVEVDYNADLFERDTVLRWIGHLECVLDASRQTPRSQSHTCH